MIVSTWQLAHPQLQEPAPQGHRHRLPLLLDRHVRPSIPLTTIGMNWRIRLAQQSINVRILESPCSHVVCILLRGVVQPFRGRQPRCVAPALPPRVPSGRPTQPPQSTSLSPSLLHTSRCKTLMHGLPPFYSPLNPPLSRPPFTTLHGTSPDGLFSCHSVHR